MASDSAYRASTQALHSLAYFEIRLPHLHLFVVMSFSDLPVSTGPVVLRCGLQFTPTCSKCQVLWCGPYDSDIARHERAIDDPPPREMGLRVGRTDDGRRVSCRGD